MQVASQLAYARANVHKVTRPLAGRSWTEAGEGLWEADQMYLLEYWSTGLRYTCENPNSDLRETALST